MTDASELNPCAHCGGKAQMFLHTLFNESNLFEIKCSKCQILTVWCKNEKYCIQKWNQRA